MKTVASNRSAAGSRTLVIDMRQSRLFRFAFCMLLILLGVGTFAAAQENLRQTAFALEQQGRNTEAEAVWLAMSKQQPSNPEPYAHLGLLEAREEHYPDAIRYYRKAFAVAPQMVGLRLNLGLAYFKNGDYEQAIGMLGPLLREQPSDQRLNVLVGMSHYGLGQFGAAAPYLKQAAKGDPQNLTLLQTLAQSCLLSKQYQCVLDAFHQIVALNAESAQADMLAGEALDEMKDRLGAIREFRAAVQANPREPNVHFGLGYLLWTKGQYPEAAAEFQAELNNDPQNRKAMLYLADAKMQMNQPGEALSLLETLVKTDPGNAAAHRDLGIVYVDEDRKLDALTEFQAALRLAPNDVNAHWRLARLYRSMGKTAEARAEFDKAKGLNETENERLLKLMSPTSGGAYKFIPATEK